MVPDPDDEEGLERYAQLARQVAGLAVTEMSDPDWRRHWTDTALRPNDMDWFTAMRVQFPRSRMHAFTRLCHEAGLSRESMIRLLCAEFIILVTGEDRATVEYDFPLADPLARNLRSHGYRR